MNKIAIFDFYIGGHHLEYIHHLYVGACKDRSNEYYFILPSSFNRKKDLFEWKTTSNVHFIFFDILDSTIRSLNPYKKSYIISSYLRSFIYQYKLTKVLLIETVVFFPFIPFMVPSGVEISSIVYQIPLYLKEQLTLKQKLFNKIIFTCLARCRCFKNVFLLNSRNGSHYYNNKYKTNKFKYLPDPYTPLQIGNNYLTEELKLREVSFLHFGGLTTRKGTLEILEAISLLPEETAKKYSFVFAGVVIEDIKSIFYKKISELKKKTQIIVYDEFCEYELLGKLCSICDYILIPYKNVGQSSGVCSYAAQFNIPVIGPERGLLGQLIKFNGLGFTMKNTDAKTIADTISLDNLKNIVMDRQKANVYLGQNSINNFNNHIFKYI